jgi:hypothetical protein
MKNVTNSTFMLARINGLICLNATTGGAGTVFRLPPLLPLHLCQTGRSNRHSAVALTSTGHRTKSCGLLAPGRVMSCGLLRLVMSCGLLGLTPGANPAVAEGAEDMFGLLGPVVPDPVEA